ncbi:TetR family transcriptional regulator [Pseudonocardia acidicola]|uniref:TetR/AcrR family transcriptional regulator n=1 Tax=Pseudonocardia acidicola TaxID=2724939 RepID=A0ABX1SM06_9PSEU|nr:TetR/AcrR family transcriptional regulator [Pseudonocardia acidicola]
MDEPRSATRRRGRRPAGEDTRGALLAAARVEFAERGFEGATVRRIADRAGVDAAMVNHWFGGKEQLFTAALELPIDPDALLAQVLPGDPEELGARIVRTFVEVWDATGGGAMVALIRSIAGHEEAARMMREFVSRVIIGRVVEVVAPDRPELRAALCGSQIIGLGVIRFVVRVEPLASADTETVVATIAPTLQRYLTGELG